MGHESMRHALGLASSLSLIIPRGNVIRVTWSERKKVSLR